MLGLWVEDVKSSGKKRGQKAKKGEESELVAEGQRQTQVVVVKKERHGKCKRETTE